MPPRRQLFQDFADRANINPAGFPWITLNGGGIQIVSQQFQGVTAAAENIAALDTSVLTNQWIEATISAQNFSADSAGVMLRLQAGAASGYDLEWGSATTTGTIYKVTAGAFVSLLTLTVTWAVGNRVRLEAQGSLLSAYQNDVLLGTIDDTTWTTGVPGLHVFNNAATNLIDTVYAGDYDAVSQPPNAFLPQ